MTDAGRLIDGYEFPEDLWYHPLEHLWLRPGAPDPAGRIAVTIGVDALGVQALGDVVYVQLLEAGQVVGLGQAVGSLEAEKMVRPVVAPISGALLEVNAEIQRAPRLLNADPYGRGWLVRIGAAAWPGAAAGLLHAAEAVEAWVRAELRAYESQR